MRSRSTSVCPIVVSSSPEAKIPLSDRVHHAMLQAKTRTARTNSRRCLLVELLISLIFAAFPVRGSVWRALDSSIVVDQDTLRLAQGCLVGGYCSECEYRIIDRGDTNKIRTLVGNRRFNGPLFSVTWNGSVVIPMNPGPSSCTPGVRLSPEKSRQFILHGTRNWAVWADSVLDTIRGGEVKKPVLVRWRWSLVDTTLPWVRWIDTILLAGRPTAPGLPVLTLLRPAELGNLGPVSQMGNLELILRAKPDSVSHLDWGFAQGRMPIPSGTTPAGPTFRVLEASNPNGGMIRWDLTGGGKAVDRLWMLGMGMTGFPSPLPPPTGRTGLVGTEVATGRRIHLASPVPVGTRLVPGPGGLRLVRVE